MAPGDTAPGAFSWLLIKQEAIALLLDVTAPGLWRTVWLDFPCASWDGLHLRVLCTLINTKACRIHGGKLRVDAVLESCRIDQELTALAGCRHR